MSKSSRTAGVDYPLSVRLPLDLIERLDAGCFNKSKVIRTAVRQWLDANEHQATEPLNRENGGDDAQSE